MHYLRSIFLAYGTAAKSNLMKVEKAQRRINPAIIFFGKKLEHYLIFQKSIIFTRYLNSIVEVLEDFFKELRTTSTVVQNPCCVFLQSIESPKQNIRTRFSSNGLLPRTYNHTFAQRKALSNSLQKSYN